MKTEFHYYDKIELTYSELDKESVIRNFRITANGSVFYGGRVE